MGYEQKLYCAVWISSIIAALIKFSKYCDKHYISPEEFEKGWNILNRVKDFDIGLIVILLSYYGFNFLSFPQSIIVYWILLLCQIVISQFLFKRSKVVFYAFYPLFCITAIIGVPATLVFLSSIMVMYLVHMTGRKSLCYLLTVCMLLLIHSNRFYDVKKVLHLEETESFLLEVGMAWLLAKCLSFAVDRINSDYHRSVSFSEITMILTYCLYLPTVFTGPIITYEEFCKQVLKSKPTFSVKNFSLCILHLFYHVILYFLSELLLHFIYSSSAQFYPEFVNTFDGWALCGLGYALPMLFHLKYYIIYGTAGSLGRLENITLPPPPKCISCVHLSSHLWRHFDRGLYVWILRYLYRPIINRKWTVPRKVFALAICFTFVAMWHGMNYSIVVWSSLNCLLVASEMTMKFISTTKIGTSFQKLPAVPRKRLSAAIATPHFIMMCISCTFFLSNEDIGFILVKRMLLGGIVPLGTLAVVMYCGCHVSMDSKQWQTEYPLSVNLLSNK